MPALHPGLPTAPYNLTSITDAGSISDLAVGINTNLGGFFGLGILITLFIIVYTIGLWKESDLAFASASWITFLISIYFGRIGVMSGSYVAAFAVVALIAVMLLWKQKDKGGY